MEKSERTNLHIRIFIRIGGKLFVPPDDPFALPLGDKYETTMVRLLKRRSEIFEDIILALSKLSVEQLAVWFDADGKPLSDEAMDLVGRHQLAIKNSFKRLKVWYFAPMFRTDRLADFDHWSRSEFLSIDEIVWLSVGLEPTTELIDAIRPFNRSGGAQKLGAVETYVSRHKESIRRKFDPHNYNDKLRFEDFHKWVDEVALPVHPEFYRMIERRLDAGKSTPQLVTSIAENLAVDGREKVSMSKLIAAMAIDAYGFDPRAKRSEIPNEIQNIADRLGLDLSSNTIRKYLKTGAELIPDDWKPE